MRHGAEEACWAHNPEVGGSKPPVATRATHVCSTRLRVRVPPRIGACTDHSWLGARAEIWRNNQRFFRLRGPMDKACAYGLANTNYSVVATIDPARVAQSAERKTLNLVVVGSSPTLGEISPITFYTFYKWALGTYSITHTRRGPLNHRALVSTRG